ncbi:MAG: mercury resistance system transport protein MerF, partial [Amylibacter sp.]|nr:mercury resistance system transport protein MerF [Amylibacter sp.]
MNDKKLLRRGLIGSVIAALCCFTPLLVLVFAGVGLSAFIGWLDYALFPLLFASLAIVAYQQPITRAEIEAIRTVDCSYSIRSLLDRSLIKITGRSDVPGRPMLYGTTKYFLEIFSLKKLDDLPRLEDFGLEQIEEAQE